MECFFLTPAELAAKQADNWYILGGPYSTESECLVACEGLAHILNDTFSYANDIDMDGHSVFEGTATPTNFFKENMDFTLINGYLTHGGLTVDTDKLGKLLAESGAANCIVQSDMKCSLILGGTRMGLVFRQSDANNFWVVEWDSTVNKFFLNKWVAGVESESGQTAGAISQGLAFTNVLVTLNGSSIVVYVDDVQVFSITDAFNQTATVHGLALYRTASHGSFHGQGYFDFFTVDPLP